MATLKFTVYELLGYILPGIVTLGAVAVVVWALFLPHFPLLLTDFSLSKEAIGIGLFITYGLGHLTQGLCNFHPSPEAAAKKNNRHANLLAGARLGLTARCGFSTTGYEIDEVVVLAQTCLLNTGQREDLDVYLYREGFYRGSCAAYLLLAGAFVLRMARATSTLKWHGVIYPISSAALWFAASLSLLFAIVFYRRYLRFGSHRLRHVLSFVCLSETTTGKDKEDAAEDKPAEKKDASTSDETSD